MKRVLIVLAILLSGCGYADRKDPKVFYESSDLAAGIAAALHAKDIGGTLNHNACCGSMEPLIYAGDWIVSVKEPFSDDLLGKVVTYYYEPKKMLLMHRLVSKDSGGFIGSGDNNKNTEMRSRITAKNYRSTVVAIYKVAK